MPNTRKIFIFPPNRPAAILGDASGPPIAYMREIPSPDRWSRPLRVLGVTPRFWPTAITLVAVVTTLGLGVWQVQRLFWKQGLIDARQAKSQAAPLTALPKSFDPAAHAFRRAAVSGAFIHAREIYLGARSLNGNLGFHVITPLRLADGGHLLVNRGWIPTSLKTPSLRAAGQLRGTVTVAGYLRGAQAQGWFTRDNKPGINMWYFVDVAAMAKATGLAQVRPYYLEAARAEIPGGYPLGGQTRLTLRNDHLQYAITWFSIALAGMVIWYLWHRRREREDNEGTDTA